MNASVELEHLLALKEEPITKLVRLWQQGNKSSYDELFSLCYTHIKNQVRIQKSKLDSSETLDVCLQTTTCLAHEAYLKLSGHREQSVEERKELYSLITQVIKTVLFDQYRKLQAMKRTPNVEIDTPSVSNIEKSDLIDIAEMEMLMDLASIERLLAQEHVRSRDVFNFKVFGGLSPETIAELLGVSLRTVYNDLRFANAWYSKYLKEQ